MTRTYSNTRPQRVTIELGDSLMHVVMQYGSDDHPSFCCRTVQWRHTAALLNSPLGQEELRQALQQLSKEESLHHRTVDFLLDGAYCITRTAHGSPSGVQQRLDEFETRCSRYLLLGHGRKVAARSVPDSEPDSDSAVGMLTVANVRTLQSISQATQAAGLNLGRISAAVADLGRLLQKVCPSAEQQSGILLRPRESGVDLAIVDSGRLLLDARPVENMDVERMHDYVQGRLALFERFYRQHSVSGVGQLEQIILCGERQITLALEERFRAGDLRVTVLDDALLESPLKITADGSLSEFGGALGALLCHDEAGSDSIPDLKTQLTGIEHRSLWRLMTSSLWPLVAGLLIAVTIQMLHRHQRSDSPVDPVALERHEQLTVEEMDISDELELAHVQLQFGRSIHQHLDRTSATTLLAGISSCLADSASITSVSIDAEGRITLNGRSLSEENVYEFAQNLERLPFITTAQLAGTGKTEDGNQLFTEFQVQAQLRLPLRTPGRDEDV